MGLKKWINERTRRGKNEALTETRTSLIRKDRYSDCEMHDRISVKSDLRTWSISLVAVPLQLRLVCPDKGCFYIFNTIHTKHVPVSFDS
jgi:hypothetical protein